MWLTTNCRLIWVADLLQSKYKYSLFSFSRCEQNQNCSITPCIHTQQTHTAVYFLWQPVYTLTDYDWLDVRNRHMVSLKPNNSRSEALFLVTPCIHTQEIHICLLLVTPCIHTCLWVSCRQLSSAVDAVSGSAAGDVVEWLMTVSDAAEVSATVASRDNDWQLLEMTAFKREHTAGSKADDCAWAFLYIIFTALGTFTEHRAMWINVWFWEPSQNTQTCESMCGSENKGPHKLQQVLQQRWQKTTRQPALIFPTLLCCS